MNRALQVVCLILVWTAGASGGSGGSAYSIFGVGDLRYSAGMRNAGMAGAGLGLPSVTSISPNSPAAWAGINRVRLEAGVLYEGFSSTDGSRSLYRAAGTFQGALLAIPVSTDNGVVFVGGFMPYSTVAYNTFTHGSQTGLEYSLNHRGNGGIGRGLAGLSYAPLPWLWTGAGLDYYFGTLEKSRTMTVSGSGTLPASGGTTTESATSHGAGVTASLLVKSFDRLSESLRPLSFGFTVSSRTKLNTTSQLRYKFTSESDSSAETSGSTVLPLSFGAGFGYQIDETYSVAVDLFSQPWERSEIAGGTTAGLRNATRFAVGGERAGSREASARWLDRVACRLGFSYTATYYRPDGNPVNEWAVTAGAGLPFSGDARINLAVEYAHRAAEHSSPITDNIIRVLLSINISEEWFVRPPEE